MIRLMSSLDVARQRTLRRLSGAYAEGRLSTGTLERRVAAAAGACTPGALGACTWDLAEPSWLFRLRSLLSPRVLPQALVVGDEDGAWRIELSATSARSVVIGRSRSSSAKVVNRSVSRRHAELSLRGDVCRIRDLGSTNGTLVNGRPVAVSDVWPGDVIQLGDLPIRVV